MPVLYLLSVTAANIITAQFAPIKIWLLIIPAGSFLVGATFILRDLTQMQHGRKKTYFVIFVALLLSAVLSVILGDGLQIVLASLAAFFISELSDTEIFTRLKAKVLNKVLVSGLFGGLLDSIIFVVVGLGPIGIGALTWHQCIYAIIGQVLIKTIMQFVGVGIFGVLFRINREKQS